MIRQENESDLGTDKISIGMWVGGDLTPNDHTQAKKSLSDFTKGRGENKFQLTKCPWCGTELDGSSSKARTAGRLGYIPKGSGVEMSCPSLGCDFSKRKFNVLPVQVVDEDIYKNPPTRSLAPLINLPCLHGTSPREEFGKGSDFSLQNS